MAAHEHGPAPDTWGLALSGGGSRAAAFHRGTLRGLIDVGLLPKIDTVSTVSGGSVFGAVWMAHRAKGGSDEDFLAFMRERLGAGFVLPTLRHASLGALRVLLPGTHLTTLLGAYFDEVLCGGTRLAELPERPRLCINTTVLENAQVGKFTAEGFSVTSLKGDREKGGRFPLGVAAAASAAFPIGLAPIRLEIARWLGDVKLPETLKGVTALHLSDGGVLENLGFQTLWKSHRLGTWNFIVSDAGTREAPWRPNTILEFAKALGAAVLAPQVLTRVLLVSHNKQNRWARQALYEVMDRSRIEADLAAARRAPAGDSPDVPPRRRLLLIQVNQTLDEVLEGVPEWRLAELANEQGVMESPPAEQVCDRAARVREYLGKIGFSLTEVDRLYEALGRDQAVARLNAVSTSFVALSEQQLNGLAAHAHWQVVLMHRLYGI